jgi:hypothetical protein
MAMTVHDRQTLGCERCSLTWLELEGGSRTGMRWALESCSRVVSSGDEFEETRRRGLPALKPHGRVSSSPQSAFQFSVHRKGPD